ncbi:ubiquitin-specific protease [Thraustotheca clavata]|uniref:Ubiquitin carboxyl-terminal hydrolase n=1 Tax=Thraustotheca clavata TaxID=74557 RepID=A0A1V9ZP45_9STRA|nr:ubiquitin-specific protease [Thraustotheca clavata]
MTDSKKECRHVSSAYNNSQLRKRLKAGGLHCCELCEGGVSLSKKEKKSSKQVKIVSSLEDVKGNTVCITCGFIGCNDEKKNHTQEHLSKHAKHYCVFRMGTQDVWCSKCDDVVVGTSHKVIAVLDEIKKSYENIILSKAKHMHMYASVESTPKTSKEEEIALPVETTKKKSKTKKTKVKEESDEESLTPQEVLPVSGNISILKLIIQCDKGLMNLGNTCYFNSTIQSLKCIFSVELADEVKNEIKQLEKAPVAQSLLEFIDAIVIPKKSGKSIYNPGQLLTGIRETCRQFRNKNQQDAYELYLALVWAIDDEYQRKSNTAPENTASNNDMKQIIIKTDQDDAKSGTVSLMVPSSASVEEIEVLVAKKLKLKQDDMILTGTTRPALNTEPQPSFVCNTLLGALVNSVTCHTCNNVSKSFDDCISISVAIPKVQDDAIVSLEDCISTFTAVNKLVADESSSSGYRCEKCNSNEKDSTKSSLQDASVQMMLYGLPKVLVVHLKRLTRLRKKSRHVQFSTQMDFAKFVEQPLYGPHQKTLYNLQAVIVHMGNRFGGHYVAYVKYPDSWYYTSDSNVQRVSEAIVLKAEAYMLFYTRE